MRAPVEATFQEPRRGQLEREQRRCLDIELVERRERTRHIAFRCGHERPRPRQRHVDPQTGDRAASRLQARENLPSAFELAQRDE